MKQPARPVIDGGPLLERAQPVDQVVDHRAAGQLADRGDHVLVRPAAAGHGAGRHRQVVLAGHPAGQVDVVGGQVHDHADVGDAVRERALAAGDDLVDVAELTGLQAAAQALQRRVVALDVADAGRPGRATRTPRPGGGPPRRCAASGFSISACTPASASCRPTSSCSAVGQATTA